jgi:hypothetical protein
MVFEANGNDNCSGTSSLMTGQPGHARREAILLHQVSG